MVEKVDLTADDEAVDWGKQTGSADGHGGDGEAMRFSANHNVFPVSSSNSGEAMSPYHQESWHVSICSMSLVAYLVRAISKQATSQSSIKVKHTPRRDITIMPNRRWAQKVEKSSGARRRQRNRNLLRM